MKKRVIAIVGMSGAGKTQAAEFFRGKNHEVLRFGSVVDEGIKAEGLSWTPENNTYYREKIRKELGMAAIAIKMMPKITKNLETHDLLILDGLYSWEEYLYLKNEFPSIALLCIYASPAIRYERLAVRKERPFSYEQAHDRDISEIEMLNKGGPIALADYLVINETNQEHLDSALEKIYEEIQK